MLNSRQAPSSLIFQKATAGVEGRYFISHSLLSLYLSLYKKIFFFPHAICMFDIREEIHHEILNADIWNVQLSACCLMWMENWNSKWGVVRFSAGEKKFLLSQSQGIAKQALTADPPMIILQPPIIITLSWSVFTQTKRLQMSKEFSSYLLIIFYYSPLTTAQAPHSGRRWWSLSVLQGGVFICTTKSSPKIVG